MKDAVILKYFNQLFNASKTDILNDSALLQLNKYLNRKYKDDGRAAYYLRERIEQWDQERIKYSLNKYEDDKSTFPNRKQEKLLTKLIWKLCCLKTCRSGFIRELIERYISSTILFARAGAEVLSDNEVLTPFENIPELQNFRDKSGASVIRGIIASGNVAFVKSLFDAVLIDINNIDEDMLHLVICLIKTIAPTTEYENYKAILFILLQNGISPNNSSNPNKQSPLHKSVLIEDAQKAEELTKILLVFDANTKQLDNYEFSPIDYASIHSKSKCLLKILDNPIPFSEKQWIKLRSLTIQADGSIIFPGILATTRTVYQPTFSRRRGISDASEPISNKTPISSSPNQSTHRRRSITSMFNRFSQHSTTNIIIESKNWRENYLPDIY